MITLANIRKAIYCLNKRIDLLEQNGGSGGVSYSEITELQNKVTALESIISEGENPTAAIDKFNEIVAFLNSIQNTDTLSGLLLDIISLIPDALIQSDWNQTNTSAKDYIKNKPIIPSLTGYATELWVGQQGYLKSHQDISGKVNSSDLATVAISGDYTDLINKPTISAALILSDWNLSDNTAKDFIKNKPSIIERSEMGVASGVATLGNDGKVPSNQLPGYVDDVTRKLEGKVDKVSGKDLSTNDYTNAEKTKLRGIEEGALVHIAPTSTEVKNALGTTSGTNKYLREDGIWQVPNYTDVSYSNNKFSKTINGNSSDIVTVDTLKSDMNLNKVENFKAVSTEANLALTDTEKNNARTNIGALSLTDIAAVDLVIADAFAQQQAEINALRSMLTDISSRINISARLVDSEEYYKVGVPTILYCSGVPNASNIPLNWNSDIIGEWTGVPRFIGQMYIDISSSKLFMSKLLTNSTEDWFQV